VRGQVASTSTGNGVSGHVLLTFHGPGETIDNTITVPITQDGWFAAEIKRWVDKFRSKVISLHTQASPGMRTAILRSLAIRSDQGADSTGGAHASPVLVHSTTFPTSPSGEGQSRPRRSLSRRPRGEAGFTSLRP
jgi:hypothetical protein